MRLTPEDQRIRDARPPKQPVNPFRPIDVLLEEERLATGDKVQNLTVFLAGAECPFTCIFCDLWRHTLNGPTPQGALPTQLRHAFESVQGKLTPTTHLKLYNASNFFDPRAVPRADEPELLRQLSSFPQVVVESHPRLVGRRAFDFARRLPGRLQIAMGVETVHPEAALRLNKRATPADFARAAVRLRENGVGLRAFVLIGAPFIPAQEIVLWAERSAAFAFEHGAEHVTLIPVRGGNGEMEKLAERGHFTPPTLEQAEEALERCLTLGPGVVTLDTWDLEGLAAGQPNAAERIERLQRINLTAEREPKILSIP